MKKLIFLIALVIFSFPTGVLALSAPTFDPVPSQINADFYTLIIHVPLGSTVTVLGGPGNLPPVTDGAGSDALDGTVDILVGLGQEQVNVFSVAASLNGEFSDSITITINETSGSSGEAPGDHTPPEAPIIDPIENPVMESEYTITGSVEADANIYVKKVDGTLVGTTQANGNGVFHITVELEAGKTNRFNIYAEDAAYNTGLSSQAIIQAAALPEPELEPEVMEPEVVVFSFVDVEGHWAEDYIREIYEMGIVSGKSPTNFEPNANITRAELTKIAVNAFNITPVESIQSFFRDVSESAWFYQYIAAAKNAKIVDGYSDNTFRPNEAINRAAALKILLEASGLELSAGTAKFSDVSNDAWFAPYVNFAQVNNIVGGYSDETFRPANNITRAEVVKIVTKILELKK